MRSCVRVSASWTSDPASWTQSGGSSTNISQDEFRTPPPKTCVIVAVFGHLLLEVDASNEGHLLATWFLSDDCKGGFLACRAAGRRNRELAFTRPSSWLMQRLIRSMLLLAAAYGMPLHFVDAEDRRKPPFKFSVRWDFNSTSPGGTEPSSKLQGDKIVLTRVVDEVAVKKGTVMVGVKGTKGKHSGWYKAITQFDMGDSYVEDVVSVMRKDDEANYGVLRVADLPYFTFVLTKAATFGAHTNDYRIENMPQMQEQSIYLFDWRCDEPPCLFEDAPNATMSSNEGSAR